MDLVARKQDSTRRRLSPADVSARRRRHRLRRDRPKGVGSARGVLVLRIRRYRDTAGRSFGGASPGVIGRQAPPRHHRGRSVRDGRASPQPPQAPRRRRYHCGRRKDGTPGLPDREGVWSQARDNGRRCRPFVRRCRRRPHREPPRLARGPCAPRAQEGKHVFLERADRDTTRVAFAEVDKLILSLDREGRLPVLMTGYHRRFSKLANRAGSSSASAPVRS